jgi:hypothetical protein
MRYGGNPNSRKIFFKPLEPRPLGTKRSWGSILAVLFLSNHFEETARNVIIRYAGRNRVEDGLGISVNFFHLDCLASEVRLNVDLDATMTVVANGCYRWLGKQLRGYEKADPKTLYRLVVATQGNVRTTPDELIVRFEKRSHNPILREAAMDRQPTPIAWRRPTNPVRLRLDPDRRMKINYFSGRGNPRSLLGDLGASGGQGV